MSVRCQNQDSSERLSLGKIRAMVRADLAAARTAALCVLVCHLQPDDSAPGAVSGEDLAAAERDLDRAFRLLAELEAKHLAHFELKLPEEVGQRVNAVKADLSTLIRIMQRLQSSSENGARVAATGQDLGELCNRRLACGLKELASVVDVFFSDLAEKEQAEEVERTGKIALEIGKIGRVINMVATNASIEAARVGDAGRGFTVIADEVKTLSSRVSSLSVSLTEKMN